MRKSERAVITLATAGAFAFFAYWIYAHVTDPESAPTFGEMWDVVQSYAVRGFLTVRGKVERVLQQFGVTGNARTIAAGLIAEEEGFSATAYPDPPGQAETYSIGYGHQIVPGDGYDQTSTISEADAFSLLLNDLNAKADCVDAAVTNPNLTANQKAALYSFTYNEGCHAFQTSTLLARLNEGNVEGAAEEFSRWVYAGGVVNQDLVARRADEQALFQS